MNKCPACGFHFDGHETVYDKPYDNYGVRLSDDRIRPVAWVAEKEGISKAAIRFNLNPKTVRRYVDVARQRKLTMPLPPPNPKEYNGTSHS